MANVSDRAALLWFFCYPHADRDGRLPADPKDLAALCLPRIMLEFRWTIPDIEAARDELLSSGLWLQVDGDPPGVEIARFREHQAGYKYDREAPSVFGGGSPRESSRPLATRKTQVQVQVQDEVEEEVQARAREEHSPSSDTVGPKNQEWPFQKAAITADCRIAFDLPNWAMSGIDEGAGKKSLDLLAEPKGRVDILRAAHEASEADGRRHDHKLADAIQQLRNGCGRPPVKTFGEMTIEEKRAMFRASFTGDPQKIEELVDETYPLRP